MKTYIERLRECSAEVIEDKIKSQEASIKILERDLLTLRSVLEEKRALRSEAEYAAAKKELAASETSLPGVIEDPHGNSGPLRARIKELQDLVWSWERDHR
jgi:hypothetical protein